MLTCRGCSFEAFRQQNFEKVIPKRQKIKLVSLFRGGYFIKFAYRGSMEGGGGI